VGWRRYTEKDGCERSRYKGKNLDELNRIFHFEGGNGR
jgi:hypothetical protein